LTSAAAVVLATVAPVLPPWPGTDPGGRLHETGLGEVLRVPLPDGSVATLNSDTRVRIGFDGMHRLLILERGETLLDVAKDRSRPFVVRAGSTEVVAVGTSFSVRRRGGDGFDVVVKEGIVDIRGPDDTLAPTRLRANFAATSRTGSDLRIEALPLARVDRRLSWRDGMLAFEGETLAVAAAEFARYSDVRLLIDDADIAARRIVGVYSSSDPAGFARAVAASFGLQVEPVPGGIRLRRPVQARLVEAGR
jgi:transmembrane sensor